MKEVVMQARARSMGHAVHPVLIVFPLGLLSTAVIFDILYLITDNRDLAIASAYTIAAGIVGGLVAAVFGLVDWTAIPGGTRAKKVGTLHGVGNVVVVLLFAVSWLFRANETGWLPNAGALVFGFAGLILAAMTGWLGGELVERMGIGVHEDASPDAPSSLQRTGGRPLASPSPRRG
jgi:uncharacterized membrane protein